MIFYGLTIWSSITSKYILRFEIYCLGGKMHFIDVFFA